MPANLSTLISSYTAEIIRSLQRPGFIEDLHREEVQLSWKVPDPGTWKLNTDGSCMMNTGAAACGSLIRDSRGRLVKGFASKLQVCNPLRAKLIGLLKGIQMSRVLQPSELLVETDSSEAFDLVAVYCPSNHHCTDIVEEISRLVAMNWNVSFKFVRREANRK